VNENKPTAGDGNETGAMPNIAELLEKEDEDFVSLHELLTAMAEGFHGRYVTSRTQENHEFPNMNSKHDDKQNPWRLRVLHWIALALGIGFKVGGRPYGADVTKCDLSISTTPNKESCS
jgi:hypothetical protein